MAIAKQLLNDEILEVKLIIVSQFHEIVNILGVDHC